MLFTIQVNNKKIKAEKGETILSALNRNGIKIPTLCRMKDFSPTGACRMCVVEVEGRDRLVTACSQPVEEWMKIKTHSPRVITARKTIVELLLSNHPDDCLYCDKKLNCELQRLAEELNIRERRIKARKIKPRLDQSSPAIVRELSKCILCGRCVRVCEEVVTANSLDFIRKGSLTHVGPAMDRDFNFSSCIHCGQCVMMCPTGALHEKHNIAEVQDFLNNTEIVKVIQYSPLVASGIAEELGIRFNRDFDRILNSMLRRIGFDKVFLTGTGTDICIYELAEQLGRNIEKGDVKPLYISACPAWVKFAEQFIPGILTNLSTIKSPQQITGVLIKTLIADQAGIKPEKIFSVSATPCMAMKFEARRDGMMRKGISDVDSVMTVRELARLIRLYGIDVSNIEPEPADEPMAGRSSAASLAEVSGGMAEAVIRTTHFLKYGIEPDKQLMKRLRTGGSFREITVMFEGKEVSVAVIDSLTGLAKLKALVDAGKHYDLIEVMTCPGGCINGAGLPFSFSGSDRKNRVKMIYQADEVDAVNLPCKSPLLNNLYNKFINENKEIADKKIFHTHFEKRNVLL
ncbi:MAG TPA: [Fe-Fe] hydrogenase large subunit C-terminal domain-containing protein [Bacteroidales bacterium]|nr:MAG: NADP-reducing hydrogenase subunit HndC [Bacteroidetes bacterium ADurb.Bin145]HOU01284.1 [Fe-Fe] hydrogenase large subunit C-terminal domain-containing protein [Bacteroidales bacterium]HQG63400.1 [Fe-Fe] hydrogenase large subunit C-terminal domain-containing protein [Bacteroidales bacterium]HQK67368.1 [Fe-Fe] hydrogenase large subunit C-terminal domain-containing protein [Bacteroidales bacterium]